MTVVQVGHGHPAAFQFTLANAFLLSISLLTRLPSVGAQTAWVSEQRPLLWGELERFIYFLRHSWIISRAHRNPVLVLT